MMAFPSLRHDDQVDTLSQLLNWLVINRQQSSSILAEPILVERSDSYRRFNNDTDIDPWL